MVVSAMVSLDEALARHEYPQARHHARVVALRSGAQGLYEIVAEAEALMTALGVAIRPSEDHWLGCLSLLHQAIDRAFDSNAPFEG